MPIVGFGNFSGGITEIPNVNLQTPVVLEECDGFDPTDGTLRPENVCSQYTAAAIDNALEQTPFACTIDGTVRVIARDEHDVLRESVAGIWRASGGKVIPNIIGTTPARIGNQVIFPTGGDRAKVMIYEPDSPSTKLRPLSFKGMVNYPGWTISASAGAAPGQTLFSCENANPALLWAAAGIGTTVDNTGTDTTVLTLGSTSVSGQKCLTIDLTGATRPLTGKSYVVLDIMIQDDEQLYSNTGLFVNDPAMLPSGYEMVLYSDAGCTVPIATLRIPRLEEQGKVYRVAFRIPALSSTCQSLSIDTASFYKPPAAGKSFKLTLYSEAFDDDWGMKTNLLLPDITEKSSPWAKKFDGLASYDAKNIVKPEPRSILVNGAFDPLASVWGWQAGRLGDWGWGIGYGRSDVHYAATFTFWSANSGYDYVQNLAVGAGLPCEMGIWAWLANDPMYAPDRNYTGCRIKLSAVCKDGGGATISTFTSIQPVAGGNMFIGPWPWQKFVLRFTTPAGTVSVDYKVERADTPWPWPGTGVGAWYPQARLYADDAWFTVQDAVSPGSAVIIDSFAPGSTPALALQRYCATLVGKSALNGNDYALMVSNQSGATGDIFADPWRPITVTLTMPAGAVSGLAAAPTAGGAGYTVNDILTINSGGLNATLRVTSVLAGVVTGVSLISSGSGYAAGAGKATIGSNGAGCTVNITSVTDQEPIDDYGDYLTHYMIWRMDYTPAGDGVWSDWKYVHASVIAKSVTWVDDGTEPGFSLNSRIVPSIIPETMDVLDSAKYVFYSGHRVYAACLGWSPAKQEWERPTSVAISNSDMPWAFPTTSSEDSFLTDGSEERGYSVTGSEVRGVIAVGDDKYVFLDTEFFKLVGDNPLTGWKFARISTVGSIVGTHADCRGIIIWHDGTDFMAFDGSGYKAISTNMVDSTKIDWTQPHNAVYNNNRYILWCKYNGSWALLIYHLPTGSWTRRVSDSLEFAGIAADSSAGGVYGIRPNGYVSNLFGSTGADYPSATAVRRVKLRMVRLSPEDSRIHHGVMRVHAPAPVDLALTLRSHGMKNDTETKTIPILTDVVRYYADSNLMGDAFSLEAVYTGTTPPSCIDFLGFNVDELVAR